MGEVVARGGGPSQISQLRRRRLTARLMSVGLMSTMEPGRGRAQHSKGLAYTEREVLNKAQCG